MSREIGFRVWSKNLNRYLRITGIQYDGDEIAGIFVVYGVIAGIPNIILLEPEDVVLEQYIGFRDKNGKKIYDGDILKEERSFAPNAPIIALVEWDKKLGRYHCHYYENNKVLWGGFDLSSYEASKMEVIGTIHEEQNAKFSKGPEEEVELED